MDDFRKTPEGRYLEYAIALLAAILIVLFVFFVRDYISLRRQQVISSHEAQISAILKNHGPFTASEAGIIRPWMTFDYINKLFDLPPNYLQNNLQITDPSYPRLSLSGYAKNGNISSATVLNEVENAIRNYSTSTTP